MRVNLRAKGAVACHRRGQLSTDFGDLAALGDGPHDEGLAARHVARGEHAVDTLVAAVASSSTLPRASSATPSCSSSPARSEPTKPIARSTSSHGISNSVPATGFGARARRQLDAHRLECFDAPLLVADEAPWSSPRSRARRPLLATTRCASTSGHAGHGFSGMRMRGGFGMSSSCVTLAAPLTVRGADAVGAGVAAADDDDALAGREDGHDRRARRRPATRRFCCSRKSIAK